MKSMDPEPNFSRTLLVLSCTAPAPEKKETRKKMLITVQCGL